jgi:hypothetical protein
MLRQASDFSASVSNRVKVATNEAYPYELQKLESYNAAPEECGQVWVSIRAYDFSIASLAIPVLLYSH